MEAFEHVVKVFLEGQGYAVTSNLKFHVTRQTQKKTHVEVQTHGYEIDIVGARGDCLLLGSVKSYFGSTGVHRQGFRGLADESKRTHFPNYKLFNEQDIRTGVINEAAQRFGYAVDAVRLALFVGKFANREAGIVRQHLEERGIQVFGLVEIMAGLRKVAESKTYVDDPVIATLKCMNELERLNGSP